MIDFPQLGNLIDKRKLIIPLSLFFTAFVFFLINNGHEQIWYDEALTLHFSRLTPGDLVNGVGFSGAEANPPFYHLIIALLRSVFGESIVLLRGFSALCGALLVPLIYKNGEKLLPRNTGLFAAMLFLFNPIALSFAQEMRMYMAASLITFLNLSSFYIALTGGKKRDWIVYSVSGIAGMYLHYYFLFTFIIVFIAFCIHVATNRSDTRRIGSLSIRFSLATGVPIIAFIPWLPALLKQMKDMSFASWTEPISIETPFKITSYFFTTKFGFDVNPLIPCFIIATLALVFAGFVFYYNIRNHIKSEPLILLLAAVVVPILVNILFSFFAFSAVNFRYFTIYLPCFILLIASGFAVFPYKNAGMLLCICFILLSLPAYVQVYTENFNGSAKDAAMYIDRNIKANEKIVTFENNSLMTISYYLENDESIYYYTETELPDCYGIHAIANKVVTKEAFSMMLRETPALWIVVTPSTKDNIEMMKQKYFLSEDPSIKEVVYKFKWSWTRYKITHLLNHNYRATVETQE